MERDKDLYVFDDFLKTTGIVSGDCALYQASDGHYYLNTIAKTASGPLFLINDRFFYDYALIYEKTKPWKLLYVKHENYEEEGDKEV